MTNLLVEDFRKFLPSDRIYTDKLRTQIEADHTEAGYSNSRTCETGLETNTGIPYTSIVHPVDECTTPKQQTT